MLLFEPVLSSHAPLYCPQPFHTFSLVTSITPRLTVHLHITHCLSFPTSPLWSLWLFFFLFTSSLSTFPQASPKPIKAINSQVYFPQNFSILIHAHIDCCPETLPAQHIITHSPTPPTTHAPNPLSNQFTIKLTLSLSPLNRLVPLLQFLHALSPFLIFVKRYNHCLSPVFRLITLAR